MNFENYHNEEVVGAEKSDIFAGNNWHLENAMEEAGDVKAQVESRLREAGWSATEIGEFGQAVSESLKNIKKASVELNITDDIIEVAVESKDEKLFDAEPESNAISAEDEDDTAARNSQMKSIVMKTDGVDFNLDRIVMRKNKKTA